MTTYTVRAGSAIAKRGAGHVRRRGGMEFGADPVTFTEADMVDLHGDEDKAAAAIAAIQADPHLRVKVGKPVAAKPEAEDGEAPEAVAKPAVKAPPVAAPVKRGRPAKAISGGKK